jgi:hypothetical protein
MLDAVANRGPEVRSRGNAVLLNPPPPTIAHSANISTTAIMMMIIICCSCVIHSKTFLYISPVWVVWRRTTSQPIAFASGWREYVLPKRRYRLYLHVYTALTQKTAIDIYTTVSNSDLKIYTTFLSHAQLRNLQLIEMKILITWEIVLDLFTSLQGFGHLCAYFFEAEKSVILSCLFLQI